MTKSIGITIHNFTKQVKKSTKLLYFVGNKVYKILYNIYIKNKSEQVIEALTKVFYAI
jgi:hypothetical protein